MCEWMERVLKGDAKAEFLQQDKNSRQFRYGNGNYDCTRLPNLCLLWSKTIHAKVLKEDPQYKSTDVFD